MSRVRVGRRAVLRGIGGTVISLPLLQAMASREVTAQPSQPPKRLIIMYSGNGTIRRDWADGNERDFTLGRILAPLAPYQDDLLLIQGVHSTATRQDGNAHFGTIPHMLTATNFVYEGPDSEVAGAYGPAGGPSVDQVIADRMGGATRFPSLLLGVRSDYPLSGVVDRMSWRAARQPVPAQKDPRLVFDRVFSELDPVDADVPTIERRARRRGSVLDYVGRQIDTLGRRVGAEDRQRLDAHLQQIRELERRLEFTLEAGTCGVPGRPPGVGDIDDHDQVPAIGRQQMELLALALACDQTRVVTLQWGTGRSEIVHRWLGHTQSHHGMSHNYGTDQVNYSSEGLVQINHWYAQQLAWLIERLKALPEGAGSVFDNTTILWTSEISDGSSHDARNIPFVLAGSLGGTLDTGRLAHVPGDRMQGDLLVTLMNAMGLDDAIFGAPAYAQGPIDTLRR